RSFANPLSIVNPVTTDSGADCNRSGRVAIQLPQVREEIYPYCSINRQGRSERPNPNCHLTTV
ncbi:MAG TPA: hypothetical protein VKX96_11110, partial [Chloroflexota bacterium]|nr:hypothetical protein [Chloroflexota bacterium]